MISKESIKKWSSYLIICGCAQFIILTAISMFFYKGGTYIDSSTTNYLFWFNFFSDLGRTVAHSGVSNTPSFILFMITLSLWGVSQIPFYVSFPSFFETSKGLYRLIIFGSIFGVVNSVSYVGIALTPSDILGEPHDIFVMIAFSSIFINSLAYSIIIFKDEKYPNFYASVLIVSAIIIGVYAVFIILTQGHSTPLSLFTYVFGQKVMIYMLLLSGIIQGYGALKHLST
ncbi:MAG: hypothetical protein ACXABO_17165 [Promethearchaeota archaeon]|jgi:hypothetical protein